MTETSLRPHAGGTTAETAMEPWTAWAAWTFVPPATRADLEVLFRFHAAVRAVADHPSASAERKEAALAALAAPFSDKAAAETTAPAAEALAGLLAARGIDSRPAWQVLQAAGQDLRKTRYRDWSDLLTWCRFAAAPMGTLAAALGGAPGAGPAVPLALAMQLIGIVARAARHHRWLGRVYLPERWFSEAGADIGDLEFARISAPLAKVRGRALDQAEALLGDAGAAAAGLGWRQRAVTAALLIELRGAVGRARRAHEQMLEPAAPSPAARRWILCRAAMQATFGR